LEIGIDGKIILKWTLKNQDVITGFIQLRIGSSGTLVNMVMNLQVPQNTRNFVTA
jgi:hypothetical protein